jgi:hypothetical protein
MISCPGGTRASTALFALTSGATSPDRVIDELKQYDFEIVSTSMSKEKGDKLREAFAPVIGVDIALEQTTNWLLQSAKLAPARSDGSPRREEVATVVVGRPE